MPEITLTEEQLQEKIAEEVKKATDELTATLTKKHNDEMGALRIKSKEEQKKAVEDAVANANLTAEEKAKKHNKPISPIAGGAKGDQAASNFFICLL